MGLLRKIFVHHSQIKKCNRTVPTWPEQQPPKQTQNTAAALGILPELFKCSQNFFRFPGISQKFKKYKSLLKMGLVSATFPERPWRAAPGT